MVNLTKSGGGGSSNSLKIYKSSAPPDVGKHGDVVLITEQNIPTSYTQPDEPNEKQVGDVWIVTGDGGVEVTLGKQPKITYSLLGAQQWDGAAWKKLDGFVWIESEWVKFSKSVGILFDLKIGTKIAIPGMDLPYGNIHILVAKNHPSHPSGTVCFCSEKVQTGIQFDDAARSWKDSYTRRMLTGVLNDHYGDPYLSRFPKELLDSIVEVENQYLYNGPAAAPTVDKLFVPCVKEIFLNPPSPWAGEIGVYQFEYFKTNQAEANGKLATWQLRSVYGGEAAYVNESGSVAKIGTGAVQGTRHFFCLKDSMLVESSPNPDGSYNLIL